jgi:hypothetical protein
MGARQTIARQEGYLMLDLDLSAFLPQWSGLGWLLAIFSGLGVAGVIALALLFPIATQLVARAVFGTRIGCAAISALAVGFAVAFYVSNYEAAKCAAERKRIDDAAEKFDKDQSRILDKQDRQELAILREQRLKDEAEINDLRKNLSPPSADCRPITADDL